VGGEKGGKEGHLACWVVGRGKKKRGNRSRRRPVAERVSEVGGVIRTSKGSYLAVKESFKEARGGVRGKSGAKVRV